MIHPLQGELPTLQTATCLQAWTHSTALKEIFLNHPDDPLGLKPYPPRNGSENEANANTEQGTAEGAGQSYMVGEQRAKGGGGKGRCVSRTRRATELGAGVEQRTGTLPLLQAQGSAALHTQVTWVITDGTQPRFVVRSHTAV